MICPITFPSSNFIFIYVIVVVIVIIHGHSPLSKNTKIRPINRDGFFRGTTQIVIMTILVLITVGTVCFTNYHVQSNTHRCLSIMRYRNLSSNRLLSVIFASCTFPDHHFLYLQSILSLHFVKCKHF